MNKLFQLFPNIKVRIWQAGPNMHILSDRVTVMITNMKFSQIFRCQGVLCSPYFRQLLGNASGLVKNQIIKILNFVFAQAFVDENTTSNHSYPNGLF